MRSEFSGRYEDRVSRFLADSSVKWTDIKKVVDFPQVVVISYSSYCRILL